MQKALKARYDEAQEEMKIARRYLENPRTLVGTSEARRCLRATLDLTEGDPKLRVELLAPLLAFVEKAQARVEDEVFNHGHTTDSLPEMRGFRLEVEIEVIKAKRSDVMRGPR